jgi:steroid 5-alpha reductase family enzyme
MTPLLTPAAALWPALVGALAILYATIGDGAWARRSAIAWMMGSWGARLTVQMLYTRAARRPESAKPEELATPGGLRYVVWAALAVLFSLPALVASRNPAPDLSVTEVAACGLWILAFAGETTADRQRLRFTAKPENAGLTCRTGLWRYSPHAHALFEGLIWIAFALFASASPWGLTAFACPLARVVLLNRGCGDDFSAARVDSNAHQTPTAR